MQYYIGMMSGTSLDGIDAVLASFNGNRWEVLTHVDISLPQSLSKRLLHLNYPKTDWQGGELYATKVAEYELTQYYAEAYNKLMRQSDLPPDVIVAVGAHGQTIRHEPNTRFPYTLQLLDGALLSELTQQCVVCDFRSRDIAAGGQGAPLAPLFHAQLFMLPKPFAVANIGGIANISLIGENSPVRGFDCGPGNCLLDEWVYQHQGQAFDSGGLWANQGKVLPQLLSQLLSDSYFSLPAPKSTGRDYFHHRWLSSFLDNTMEAVDVMRTLVALTAQSLVDSLPDEISQLVLVGGGAKNKLLVSEIQTLLTSRQTLSLVREKGVTVMTGNCLGIDVQQVEALGFALLARDCVEHKKVDTRMITGATHPVVLGAIYR